MRRMLVAAAALLALVVLFLLLAGPQAGEEEDALERSANEAAGDGPWIDRPPREGAASPALQGRATPSSERSQRPTGVRVQVRMRCGAPYAGARVVAYWKDAAGQRAQMEGRADPSGVLDLAGVPRDGSARVAVLRKMTEPPMPDDLSAVVRGPDVELVATWGMPLRVVPVDAEDGTPFESVTRYAGTAPGERRNIELGVEPPKGFVVGEDTYRTVAVGLWTRELLAYCPLRREAHVRVTVLDHTGRPEHEATIRTWLLADKSGGPSAVESEGSGSFRLRGLPFFRGASVLVEASSSRHRHGHWGHAVLGRHATDRVDVVVKLPSPDAEPLLLYIDPDIVHDQWVGDPFAGRGESSARGAFLVRVLRHDGSPAAGAFVALPGWMAVPADAQGEVRFDEVPATSLRIRAYAPGMLPTRTDVVVAAGAETVWTLQEPRGGALDLRVVDEEGRPLPYATFSLGTVRRHPWVDEQDGVQRVDLFVDHLGRRSLERVAAGTPVVSATWAHRKGSVEVAVREGERTRVTLVLHPAESSDAAFSEEAVPRK